MTMWYEANVFAGSPRIKPVEVERVTDASVWVNGRRRSRCGDWNSFFESFDEAKDWVVQTYRRRHEAAKRELDRQRQYLQQAEALKVEPK